MLFMVYTCLLVLAQNQGLTASRWWWCITTSLSGCIAIVIEKNVVCKCMGGGNEMTTGVRTACN